jgi:hypothetical protein
MKAGKIKSRDLHKTDGSLHLSRWNQTGDTDTCVIECNITGKQ